MSELRGSRLAGRVVIVVGAGSMGAGWGNGKASAVAYAREGATVVCADFHVERAAETVDLITAEGGTALAVRADATDESSVRAVVDVAVARFGKLDVMHNNVGVGGTSGLPDQIEPTAWAREIDQNLTTAYLGIRCAVPALRAAGGGSIVNISSKTALTGQGQTSGYVAAKAAQLGLTREWAAALVGDGVRVSLDVGCVRMTERFGEDVEAVRAHVRALLPEASPSRAVGVAGTVTTIVGALMFLIGLLVRPGGTPGLIALAGGGALLLFLGTASVSSTVAKPVTKMLNDRTARIEASLREADQVKQQLASAKSGYEAELQKARQEAAATVAQAQDRAKVQEAEIIAQARREADRIREEARTQAMQERDQMLREAKNQIADLVTLTASRVLDAELKAGGHDKLIAESLAALDRRN